MIFYVVHVTFLANIVKIASKTRGSVSDTQSPKTLKTILHNLLENLNSQRHAFRYTKQTTWKYDSWVYFILNLCVGVPRCWNSSLFVMFDARPRESRKSWTEQNPSTDASICISAADGSLILKHRGKHGWSEDKLFGFFSLLLGSIGLPKERELEIWKFNLIMNNWFKF